MQTSAPIMKQGWLNAIIFLPVYIGFIFGATSLASLIRVKQFIPANIVYSDFITVIVVNFFVSMLTVWLFCRLVNRQSFASLGWRWKGYDRERFSGLIAGLLLVTVIASVLWLMQLVQWFMTGESFANMVIMIALMMIVAVGEELVFRGYLLNSLMQSMNKEMALLVSALLFAGFHLLNPDYSIIGFINIFTAGLLLGINYIFTRNLWFSVFLHFAWNFFQGPVLGFKVSGIELPSLLEQNMKGGMLLTGARFGLEASLLTTITMVIAIIIFYYLFRIKYTAAGLE